MTNLQIKDLETCIEHELYDDYLTTWNYADAWEIIEDLLKIINKRYRGELK